MPASHFVKEAVERRFIECLTPRGYAIAREEPGGFHAFEEGSNGVRVAAHEGGEFALSDAVIFQQSAHDGELVRGDVEMGDAPPESLIEAIPGAPQ